MYMSSQLAEALERSEIEYMTDRMIAIQEREGNPMGVELHRLGTSTLLYSKAMPWPQFNTIKGFSDADLPQLDEMLDLYRERGRKATIELVPGRAGKETMQALLEKDCRPVGYHASFYRGLQSEAASVKRLEGAERGAMARENDPSHRIDIRPLQPDEIDIYARIHCLGTGLPLSGAVEVAHNNRVLLGREGWSFYLASLEGEAAGVSVMYTKGNAASLTFAAVLPEVRGRGIQQALIQRRLRDAEMQGAVLAVSQAAFASTSHRNMERCGMRLGYTRATWMMS
ncbi:GNAT family N-acetyltransferase [Paenibacillus turpanensis]|uniref:GNAT family N-acetyltransferase n=1 Tax=Paenibacillus turpanensis TaxID=2689078 RepID=UPI001409034E|nr:GNAT family N-acetyltransferase [Paenibacillus turpanensis]